MSISNRGPRAGLTKVLVLVVSLGGLVGVGGACGGELANPCGPLDGAACYREAMCKFVWTPEFDQRCLRACNADDECDDDTLEPMKRPLVPDPSKVREHENREACVCVPALAAER